MKLQMNLFLLFASLTLFYFNSSTKAQAAHELRIEDLQKPTRMNNGIIIMPMDNSNEDIISLERSVIRFLINHHYIVEDFIYQWERLKRRHLLNQDAQNKILINEATIYKAIKKYQEDNALPQTGIMDMRILKKVFGDEYNGRSMIDAGGVYFLENIKTYGEDDPSIGKALRFKDPLPLFNETHSTSKKKRSAPSGPSAWEARSLVSAGRYESHGDLLRMAPREESNRDDEKKSNDLNVFIRRVPASLV